MNDLHILDQPKIYPKIQEKCKEIGFSMPSDVYIGTLLKTLITSKPKANLLELGTGIGLTLSWMIDSMDQNSKLTTIDNDSALIEIAKDFFGHHKNVEIICEDGGIWLQNYTGEKFDLIFADAWPGKYYDLELTLSLLNSGGFYIIDDMTPTSTWPEGHSKKADNLIDFLEKREDLVLTKMSWSTGIIVASKK